VRLAARGLRDMDAGVAAITDAGELAQVRRQSRGVHLKSMLVAVAITAISVII
jgi:hypothetical protein